MKFNVRPLLGASCLMLSLAGAGAQAQETVKMGAVLSLTGANATVGEDVRRAVDLAVEKVNADGGVMGKKFAVVIEDSGGNPTTALNAAPEIVTFTPSSTLVSAAGAAA